MYPSARDKTRSAANTPTESRRSKHVLAKTPRPAWQSAPEAERGDRRRRIYPLLLPPHGRGIVVVAEHRAVEGEHLRVRAQSREVDVHLMSGGEGRLVVVLVVGNARSTKRLGITTHDMAGTNYVTTYLTTTSLLATRQGRD